MLKYAFSDLDLLEVYLFVNKNNIPAIVAYEKCGFREKSLDGDTYYMIIEKDSYHKKNQQVQK